MARCVIFAWILIYVICVVHQDVEAGKPEIIPPTDVIYIDEGNELKIECRSWKKTHISTQTLVGDYPQSNFTIIQSFDEDSCVSTLTRPHAIAADTGWYGCAEEGITIENDHQTIDHESDDIAWIYVYVKSEQQFAVIQQLDILPVMVGNSVVIPCRPTSPDLKVILEINGGAVAVPESTVYYPKIGFIIRNVTTAQSGEYYACKIDESQSNDSDHPLYSLIVEVGQLPAPVIDQKRLRHVVSGQSMTLECRITVSPISTAALTWSTPSSVPAERRHVVKKWTEENYEAESRVKIVKTNLIVDRVEKSYGGKYTCFATGAADSKTETSTNIKIWDPSHTYINVSMDNEKLKISQPEKKSAKWRLKVDAYPEDVQWKWYRPDRSEIDVYETGSKYSHEIKDGINHFFEISDLDIRDSGKYTVNISTSSDFKIVVLELTVCVHPVARIDKPLSAYPPGDAAIFYCHTYGSPVPNVTWIYMEYPDFPSKKRSVNVSVSNIQETSRSNDPFKLVSVLNITVNKTGDLICKACNIDNCTETVELISVSDDATFFKLITPGPREPVVEGDNVTLECIASRRNFTRDIKWNLPLFIKAERMSKRIEISQNPTDSKLRSTLQIRNVSLSDSGIYSCEATYKKTGNKTEEYNLMVEKAVEPRIVNTNMKGSKVVVKLKDVQSMTLNCSAEGRPTPKVLWFKDDELIESSNRYQFSAENFALQITFVHEKDTGRYLCRAENRLGRLERYIDIVIEVTPPPTNNIIWISLICVLIVIIIMVITYMLIKVRREKRLRKELLDSGLEHFREGALESLNPDLTIDEQVELLPYDNKWEFPRDQLKLGKQLGSGAFGVVLKARAQGICEGEEVTTVAVKMVRRTAEPSYMKALASELKIMIHLGRHVNVVNVLGACTETILTKRELLVIVEYCQFGNLHNYLQRHRDSFINQIVPSTQRIDPNIGLDGLNERKIVGSPNKSKYTSIPFSPSVSINSSDSNNGVGIVGYYPGGDYRDTSMSPDSGILSNNSSQPGWRSNYRGDYKEQNLKPICTQDLICWAWQVSRGMEYLSSRNVLHGDLAARNILLADDNVVKICDFGLAKNMYKDNNYKKKGDGPVPIKWMAIESIRDRIFSTQSDVWSFGIVLWEFFTLARTPYPGMEAEKQLDRLIEGYRMEKPEFATDEIYDFMLSCWRAEPSLRPTFSELVQKTGHLLNEQLKTHYSDLNTPYMNMNAAARENGQSDYLTMMSSPTHNYYNAPSPFVEVQKDSTYVPMNQFPGSSQPRVSTPHPKFNESIFKFSISNQEDQVDLDLENCTASVPMLARSDARKNPDEEENLSEKRSEYCNVTIDPRYSNLNDRLSSTCNENSDSSAKEKKLRVNDKKEVFSPIISGRENLATNTPEKNTSLIKDHTLDRAVSNPSYVIMSKSQLK